MILTTACVLALVLSSTSIFLLSVLGPESGSDVVV